MLFKMKNLQNFKLLFYAFFCLNFFYGCKKEKSDFKEIEKGTVIDADGNLYTTVKIGNQWWMAENLKVKTYADGSSIPKIQSDSAKWNNDTTGAYCVYDDNTNAPGLLYNWYAVNKSKNIAPVGWHIPSDDEWKELEKYIGMSVADADKTSWRGNNEAEKLKVASPNGWTKYASVWSTNETGFSALAGGCRLFNGVWGQPGLFATGFWWSSTTKDNHVWYRYLDYKNSNVFRYYGSKTYGFSVRCVKD